MEMQKIISDEEQSGNDSRCPPYVWLKIYHHYQNEQAVQRQEAPCLHI